MNVVGAPSPTSAEAPSVQVASIAASASSLAPSPPFSNSSSPAVVPSGNQGNGPASSQQVWVVKVGSPDGKFVFSPEVVQAAPGDLVQFQFYARNHSVASSSFDTPCVPNNIQQGSAKAATNAFFSGFMPTSAEGSLAYTIAVTDSSPQWFYCTQGQHCQAGMVGVINPPPAASNQTIQAFTALAKNAPENVTPTFSNTNGGTGKTGPPASASSSNGNLTTTQTGLVAQSTRSAASTVRHASWGLLGAALMVWVVL